MLVIKHLIYNADTGVEEFVDVPDPEMPEEVKPPITAEEQRLRRLEAAATDTGDTQQQLIELLIDAGVF